MTIQMKVVLSRGTVHYPSLNTVLPSSKPEGESLVCHYSNDSYRNLILTKICFFFGL